jgi:ligand-binding SRPBCC domain-containing protein
MLERLRPRPLAAIRRARFGVRNPEHVYRTRTRLPLPIERVFAFFSAAENLELITPPELSFRIETPGAIELQRGALIDYRLSLFGMPFRWRTEIAAWLPPFEFVDAQLRGPYAQWIHRHRFHEEAGETVMEDEVRYRLPLPVLGEIALPLVKLQIARIFRYRERRIRELLLGAEEERGRTSAFIP